jgi:hypothetical protein
MSTPPEEKRQIEDALRETADPLPIKNKQGVPIWQNNLIGENVISLQNQKHLGTSSVRITKDKSKKRLVKTKKTNNSHTSITLPRSISPEMTINNSPVFDEKCQKYEKPCTEIKRVDDEITKYIGPKEISQKHYLIYYIGFFQAKLVLVIVCLLSFLSQVNEQTHYCQELIFLKHCGKLFSY